MTSKQLKDIIEMAGCETRAYSGRGMYGKECLAFTADSETSGFAVAADLMEAALDAGEDFIAPVIEAMRGIRTDSLGLGTVFYFPSVAVDGLRFEEDDFDAPGEGNPAQWRLQYYAPVSWR